MLRNRITRGFKGIGGCRPPFFEVLSDLDQHRSFGVFFAVKDGCLVFFFPFLLQDFFFIAP